MIALSRCPRASLSIFISLAILAQFGCATVTAIPDGTRTLREVAHVLSQQDIQTGNIQSYKDNHGREPLSWPWLYCSLLIRNIPKEDLRDGSVVLLRAQFYRHNVLSGIVRHQIHPAFVPEGRLVVAGNIVEAEVTGGFLAVLEVRYDNLDEGSCEYRIGDRGSIGNALDSINPIGGPGATSLYCPEIDKRAGWRTKMV